MQNEQPTAPTPEPVVPNVQMPKLTAPQGLLATLNAFSITLAAFFGINSIFGAIAHFTKSAKEPWSFGVPVIGNFSIAGVPTLFLAAFISVVFGLIGILTLKKITDAEVLKKSYAKVSAFFAIVSVILTSIAVGTIIYALLALGEKSGVDQGDLWLSGFLPALILAVASVVATIIAKQVAAGKTAILRIFSLIALGVAVLGFILVVISTLVNFYGKKTSSSYDDFDLRDYFIY
jgi:MFS family permease